MKTVTNGKAVDTVIGKMTHGFHYTVKIKYLSVIIV